MKLHLGSFLLGYATGAGTMLLAGKMRPALVEIATSFYKMADAVLARFAMSAEDLEDLMAEAKARARCSRAAPEGNHHQQDAEQRQ